MFHRIALSLSRLRLDELAVFNVVLLTLFSSFIILFFLPYFLFFSVFQEVSVSWRVGLRRSGRRQAGAADWTSSTGGRLHPGLSRSTRDRDAAQWKLRGHKVRR